MRSMQEVRVNYWTKIRLWARTGLYTVFSMSVLLGVATQLYAAEPYELKFPLGLKKELAVIPDDNPMTKEKVELGKLLFFDTRLSKNDSIACASCHIPSLAFTDGQAVSTGIHRQQGGRSAPTAINRVFSSGQFWDGRAVTLEEQSVGPLTNPVEHGFANHEEVVAKLKSIDGYKRMFQHAFGSGISAHTIGQAIASFQRTLLSGNSPFDQHDSGSNSKALSAGAQNGLTLFRGKALCFTCHSGSNFTDEKFHNLGVDWDRDHADLGRYIVTKSPKDVGAFKTPTLREISQTAPYMHDGRFSTLRQVVDFYDRGGIDNPRKDPLIQPLKLTEPEKEDLVEFLRSLSGEGWRVNPPTQFPK
ncbi:MAG: cytochrome-c peroxidase [Nitrospirales bacterium]|nr:MAG: cytochrome-c peroxidase [Nitrospirales bacterium]